MHKSLVAGRKTRGYTRYSLLLFPLLFCLISRCSRRWSPGAGDPRCRLRRWVPRWPGVAWSSQAGGLAFRSVPLIFVLAFLRQNLTNYVCTQILCLINLCIRTLGSLVCNIVTLSYFSGIFGTLLIVEKPEIQKQQKTRTGTRVHWVNLLVQIWSKVYESSSNMAKSHKSCMEEAEIIDTFGTY